MTLSIFNRLSDYRGEMEFAKIKEGEGIEMSDFDGQVMLNFSYDKNDRLCSITLPDLLDSS